LFISNYIKEKRVAMKICEGCLKPLDKKNCCINENCPINGSQLTKGGFSNEP